MIRFFIITLLSLACSRASVSTTNHDFGKMVADNAKSYLWQDVGMKEYRNLANKLSYLDADYHLADHEAAHYLNGWVSEIHKLVMRKSNGLDIPEPKVILETNEASIGGYVRSLPFCTDVKVILKKGRNSLNTSISKLSLDVMTGKFTEYADKNCVKVDDKVGVEILTDNFKDPSCYTVKDSTIFITEACSDDEVFKDEFIDEFVFKSTSFHLQPNLIFIPKDNFTKLSEETAISILAHELAHYYRLHVLNGGDSKEIVYQLDEHHNLSHKPKQTDNKELIELAEKLRQQKLPPRLSNKRAPYLELHPQTFLYVKNNYFIFQSCYYGKCDDPCSRLSKFFQSDKTIDTYPYIEYDFNDPIIKSSLLKSENLIKSCLLNISNKGLGPEKKKELTANRYEYIGAELINLEKYENFYETLMDYNRNIENAVQQQLNKIFVIVEEANEKKLGIYTDEQEADELSLEFIARLDISAAPIIKFFSELTSLLKMDNMISFPGTISSSECAAAYDNGFKNFIPISDYYDTHHETCFRAYNLYREIEAHKDDLNNIKVTTKKKLNQEKWRELARNIELEFPARRKRVGLD